MTRKQKRKYIPGATAKELMDQLEADPDWVRRRSFERPYPEALPILLEHLRKPHRGEVLEDLGRALGVPEARPLWPKLVELYRSATDAGAKTGLADAITILARKDKGLLDEVIALTKDPEHGPSRLFFIDVLARSRDPRAYATMVELKDDPDLFKEIAFRLERSESNARRRAKRRGQDLH